MDSLLLKNISTRIKEERERTGLSSEAFAELIGVSRSAHSRYERGERPVTLQWLLNADKFGLDIIYILKGVRCCYGDGEVVLGNG